MYKLFLALRSLIFYVLMISTALFFMLGMYLTLMFPFQVRLSIGRSWTRLSTQLAKWICGISYEVKGLEHLPAQPVVFLSRHESAWETMSFAGILPPLVYVCKKSLMMVPIIGWGMYISRQIPIDRSQGVRAFKKVIEQGKNRLQQGLSIAIFPEGTRVTPGQYPHFHKTGAALAKACGAPVVPIALNSGHCWPKNSFIKYPGKITVVIGEPIDSKAYSAEEISHLCYEWIKQERQ
ncbi:MAG: acyl-phosphate glycerol 3-phosphate acyltransferase [Gammaproteobacteria bacterium]|jgi:1-acyl-sn-glycerol-3-phosphate acyltransferase|nr:acyl-phosphate glycerol 3-phosphate acyltransferase [Gammaproteobacteria bacterium]